MPRAAPGPTLTCCGRRGWPRRCSWRWRRRYFSYVVKRALNRPAAYIAVTAFALHPSVLINGRRAMMEGSHLLGLMLVLLAAICLLQERRPWRYLMLGASAGFAIAAKHPNRQRLRHGLSRLRRQIRCGS